MLLLDRGVTLAIEVPGDTPDIMTERSRFEIVLNNLLNNALKYTPPGGQVKISAHPEGCQVRFVVEDTGTGIPTEHLPHIFEKFFRVPGHEHQHRRDCGPWALDCKGRSSRHTAGILVWQASPERAQSLRLP